MNLSKSDSAWGEGMLAGVKQIHKPDYRSACSLILSHNEANTFPYQLFKALRLLDLSKYKSMALCGLAILQQEI